MYDIWLTDESYSAYWQTEPSEHALIFRDLKEAQCMLTIMTPLGSYQTPLVDYSFDCVILENPNNELLRDVEHLWHCFVDSGTLKLAFEGKVVNVVDNKLFLEFIPKIMKMHRRQTTRVPIYGTQAIKLKIDNTSLSVHNLSHGGCGAQLKELNGLEKSKIYDATLSIKTQNIEIPLKLQCKHINFVQRTESQKYYTLGFSFLDVDDDTKTRIQKICDILSKNK